MFLIPFASIEFVGYFLFLSFPLFHLAFLETLIWTNGSERFRSFVTLDSERHRKGRFRNGSLLTVQFPECRVSTSPPFFVSLEKYSSKSRMNKEFTILLVLCGGVFAQKNFKKLLERRACNPICWTTSIVHGDFIWNCVWQTGPWQMLNLTSSTAGQAPFRCFAVTVRRSMNDQAMREHKKSASCMPHDKDPVKCSGDVLCKWTTPNLRNDSSRQCLMNAKSHAAEMRQWIE